MPVVQELLSLLPREASLLAQRLLQGMMAFNQELVTSPQPLKQSHSGHASGLPGDPSIARETSQDQIPDSIDQRAEASLLEYVRKEVINIGVGHSAVNLDIGKAIKALSFLI